jgi:mono/diheme cytochrome c family protein
MNRKWIIALVAVAVLLPVFAQQSQPPAKTSKDSQAQPAAMQQSASRGEVVFKQNCARCHDAPQSFAPQISGTVIRHMRVRASLSAKDERELLKFLNP